MGQRQRKLSRRELLIGLGLASAGAAACVCGGGAVAGMWYLNQINSEAIDSMTLSTVTPSPNPIPQVPKPPMIARASWGASAPNHSARREEGFYSATNVEGWRVYDVALAEIYRTVIIHHAAFWEDDDLSTLREVQRVHREDRQWADVAYHFLVGQNGLIYEGRDWHVRGTHVGGYNTGSLGICLLGNFMTQMPTESQLNSTLALLRWGTNRLQLTHIASHKEFNPQTLCPGDNLHPYLEQFAQATGLTLGIEGYVPPDGASACACCDCETVT